MFSVNFFIFVAFFHFFSLSKKKKHLTQSSFTLATMGASEMKCAIDKLFDLHTQKKHAFKGYTRISENLKRRKVFLLVKITKFPCVDTFRRHVLHDITIANKQINRQLIVGK
jgi:hypothetical protein